MRQKSSLLFVLLLVSLTCTAYAHPGKTDSNGGHHDRSTGEYHYHHGYPAHQHYGGVCPYAYDDRTGQNSGSSGSSSSGSSNGSPSSGQHSHTYDSKSAKNQGTTPTNRKTIPFNTDILVLPALIIFFFICLAIDAIKEALAKVRKCKQLDAPKKPPAAPPPSQASPQEPPRKRPHRLDLSDRFNVSYNGKLVTLYGLPCTQISHVGYLRETRQLFVRFRSSGLAGVYFDVPLAVCSEFVRSQYPDRYYSTFIDQKFLIQHIDTGTGASNDS